MPIKQNTIKIYMKKSRGSDYFERELTIAVPILKSLNAAKTTKTVGKVAGKTAQETAEEAAERVARETAQETTKETAKTDDITTVKKEEITMVPMAPV